MCPTSESVSVSTAGQSTFFTQCLMCLSSLCAGEMVTKQPLIRSMRTVKRETLKLISGWVSRSNDPQMVRNVGGPDVSEAVRSELTETTPINVIITTAVIYFYPSVSSAINEMADCRKEVELTQLVFLEQAQKFPSSRLERLRPQLCFYLHNNEC